jgi:inorganic triphosphatase YgiF
MILDQGVIRAGDEEALVSEIELELLEGGIEPLVDLANELAGSVPLRIGVLTKAERGFALAEGTLTKVSKAPPLDLVPGVNAGDGFTAICLSCLKHFRLNEPLIVSGRQPAALHQARVAMRRLRSALSLFRPMLRKDPRFAPLREELRWFTNQLGEARNLDVFLGRFDEEDGSRQELSRAREASYNRIIATLASKRFRTLLLDLLAWLATGAWRDSKRFKRPLLAFTNSRIDALWHDIAEQGEDLAALQEEPRHRLRIDIKKIRYALEFVRGLHAHNAAKQKRFGLALEGLQEALGRLNDMATAREIAARHLGRGEGAKPLEDGEEERGHLRDAKRHFARVKKVGTYWREPA